VAKYSNQGHINKQPHLSAIVQSRRLSLFGHIARMPDETDAKQILTASPAVNWTRPLGVTSSYYMDENHSAGSEIQRPQYGRRSWPGSEPSTLEIDVYVWRYAVLVVLARNDDDEGHMHMLLLTAVFTVNFFCVHLIPSSPQVGPCFYWRTFWDS